MYVHMYVYVCMYLPINVKQLRSFVSNVSFYQKFIQEFSAIAEPLFQLLRKDKI